MDCRSTRRSTSTRSGARCTRLFTDAAALRQGRRHVGAVDADRRGRGDRRPEQGPLPRHRAAAAAAVIEGCLERDPGQRFPSVQAVVQELRAVLRDLPTSASSRFSAASDRRGDSCQRSTGAARGAPATDPTITPEVVAARRVAARVGLRARAEPRPGEGPPDLSSRRRAPTWSRAAQFPDANIVPQARDDDRPDKLADPRGLVEHWQQYFWPILKHVRDGLLTTLHKVIYDANTSSLLLFSEYVDEPRFGERIAEARPARRRRARARVPRDQAGRAALHEHGMAHNNVSPGRAAVQGRRRDPHGAARDDRPGRAVAGAEAMAGDTRALAWMVLSWLRPNRIACAARPHQADVRRAARQAVCVGVRQRSRRGAVDRRAQPAASATRSPWSTSTSRSSATPAATSRSTRCC